MEGTLLQLALIVRKEMELLGVMGTVNGPIISASIKVQIQIYQYENYKILLALCN